MNNPPKNSATTSTAPKRKRHPSPLHSARDKAQAVLAVWTERCKPAEVCRQLQINSMTFHQWQSRAMEGMLQALESRINLAKGEALGPRLQALLSHRQKVLNPRKLSSRLEQIQLARKEDLAAQPQ